MTVTAKKSDWNVLFNFGMPMNIQQTGNSYFSYDKVVENIITASIFLIKNKNVINYNRYSDSFKALIIALKIRYPSRFQEIEKKADFDLSAMFDLDNISGRDIKLRNISLHRFVEYFNGIPGR